MSWRLSTGLRNALLEKAAFVPNAVSGTTISFGDGDGSSSRDTINDSGSGLADFTAGDYLTVLGSTSNDGTYKLLSVTAGIIEIAAGSLVAEAAGDAIILASAEGGSYRGIFRNCIIDIYSGSQPTSADDAETGTKLCRITESSGAFVAGAVDNGLNFGQVAAAVLGKEVGEVWSGVNLATGTAGWFRIYANDVTTGASTTGIRIDGACATSGAQLNLTSTSLTVGVTTTIDQVNLSMPAS